MIRRYDYDGYYYGKFDSQKSYNLEFYFWNPNLSEDKEISLDAFPHVHIEPNRTFASFYRFEPIGFILKKKEFEFHVGRVDNDRSDKTIDLPVAKICKDDEEVYKLGCHKRGYAKYGAKSLSYYYLYVFFRGKCIMHENYFSIDSLLYRLKQYFDGESSIYPTRALYNKDGRQMYIEPFSDWRKGYLNKSYDELRIFILQKFDIDIDTITKFNDLENISYEKKEYTTRTVTMRLR